MENLAQNGLPQNELPPVPTIIQPFTIDTMLYNNRPLKKNSCKQGLNGHNEYRDRWCHGYSGIRGYSGIQWSTREHGGTDGASGHRGKIVTGTGAQGVQG